MIEYYFSKEGKEQIPKKKIYSLSVMISGLIRPEYQHITIWECLEKGSV